MVSMVIVLFLVAVLISLFAGRLAETLTDKYRHRAERRKSPQRLRRPAADAVENEAV